MPTSLANGSLASLAELGRRRGALTAADLQRFLPIEVMSSEDIARVISDLEDQGVEISFDPDLLVPRLRSPARVYVVETEPASPMRVAADTSRAFDQAVRVVPTLDDPHPGRLEGFSLALAGLIVCGAAAALVWSLG